MLSYEEALRKARSVKSSIIQCSEYDNAYIFAGEDDFGTFGGSEPVVILKDSGRAICMTAYADGNYSGEKRHIRTFKVEQ